MTNEERLLRQIARDLHRLTVKLVGEEPKRESAASVSSLLRIGPKGPGAVMIESGDLADLPSQLETLTTRTVEGKARRVTRIKGTA